MARKSNNSAPSGLAGSHPKSQDRATFRATKRATSASAEGLSAARETGAEDGGVARRLPRHAKQIGGRWHYYRRVPRAFAEVEPRAFVKQSLKTDSEAVARRLAEQLAAADDERWRKLVLARIEDDTLKRRSAEEAAERAYQRAVAFARHAGFQYRVAAEVAAEPLGDIRRRIERLEKAGMIDLEAGRALLGGVHPPAWTFRRSAEAYIDAHGHAWKNPKHRAQWSATLTTYVFPTMGDIDVGDVDVALVLNCLEPIWREKPETASRVRMRIEAVLDWAQARGFRSGANPARWKGHLDKLLPARPASTKRHHPALPFTDIPEFMPALRAKPGIGARAVEFAILTAARSGEARLMRWSEVDMDERLWTVPTDRMKAGREHRVPLSKPALQILQAGEGKPDDFVFPSPRGGALSDMALLQVLRDMGEQDQRWAGITVHGFRSTFRDWAAERTAHPGWVAEMALAHVVADKVEAAYRRGELLEKRQALMDDWAKYCRGV